MEVYINEGVRVNRCVFEFKNEMIFFYIKWNGFDILFDVYCIFYYIIYYIIFFID